MPVTPQTVLPTTIVDGVTDENAASVMPNFVALRDGLNAHSHDSFNVKYYGAVGNGTTNDTSAIQSAITAAAAAGGGTVFFPKGIYVCNGVTIPVGKPIVLQGQGIGNTGDIKATTLRRTVNGSPVVSAVGGADSFNVYQRVYVDIRDMELDGGGFSSDVLRISKASHMQLSSLRVMNGGGIGAHLTEIWDSFADRLLVESCGSGTASPACLIDAAYSGSATDTFHFSNCIWQTNGGTDIKITGIYPGTPANNVRFTNTKMENSVANVVAPYIDFDYAQNCGFVGLNIYCLRSGSNTVQQGVNSGQVGYRPNSIIGADIDCAQSTPTNILKIDAGWFQIVAVNFQRSAAGTQDVYIAAAVPQGAIQISAARWSAAVTDLRGFNEHLELTSQNLTHTSRASYGSAVAAGATLTTTLNWDIYQNGNSFTPFVTLVCNDTIPTDCTFVVTGFSGTGVTVAVKNNGTVSHGVTVYAVAIPW